MKILFKSTVFRLHPPTKIAQFWCYIYGSEYLWKELI